MMAKVPQLEPVAKAMNPVTRKTSGATSAGVRNGCTWEAKNGPVPIALHVAPRARASTSNTASGSMPPAPLNDRSTYSCTEKMPWVRLMTAIIASARRTAQSTDVEPDAWFR